MCRKHHALNSTADHFLGKNNREGWPLSVVKHPHSCSLSSIPSRMEKQEEKNEKTLMNQDKDSSTEVEMKEKNKQTK